MHILTKQALSRLKLDNITVSPEDAIQLNEYAEKTNKISDQRLLCHSGKYCGNIEIYPLTLGAKVWLKEDALAWFEHEEIMFGLAYLYALAHSRYPDKFTFKNSKKARKAILKWAKTVNATEEEIEALSQEPEDNSTIIADIYQQILTNPAHLNLVPLINFVEQTAIYEKDEGITPIIAWLIANCGQTVEYWLWNNDWESINRLIIATQEQMTGDKVIDSKDPSIFAMKKFQKLLLQIRTK